MIWSYRTYAQNLKSTLSLGAVLLLIVSTSVWAQPIKDVKKWLKEFKGQLRQSNISLTFSGTNDSHFNVKQNTAITDIDKIELAPALSIPDDDNFDIKYKKIVRANRKRLRLMLKKAVEINIINRKDYRKSHRFYINTVEQYIASNHRIGQLKYDFYFSKRRSQFDIRYTFF